MELREKFRIALFPTHGDGRLLHAPHGLWTRPFVIPDTEARERLLDHILVRARFSQVIMVSTTTLFMAFWRDVVGDAFSVLLVCLCAGVAMACLHWAFDRVFLDRDLRGLPRLERRLTIDEYYGERARSLESDGRFPALLFILWMAGLWQIAIGSFWFGSILVIFTTVFGMPEVVIRIVRRRQQRREADAGA